MQIYRLPKQWLPDSSGLPLPLLCLEHEWPGELPAHLFAWAAAALPGDGAGSECSGPAVLSRLVATLAVSLQCGEVDFLSARIFVDHDRCSATSVAFTFIDEVLALDCGVAAYQVVEGTLACGATTAAAFAAQLAQLVQEASRNIAPGRPTDSLWQVLSEAAKRGIPVGRLAGPMMAFRLGVGARQRRVWKGFTAATSHLATVLSTHKDVSSEYLASQGFPVPKQHRPNGPQEAVVAAGTLGYPVVVKPASADYGTAVSTGLMDEAAVLAAYEQAGRHGRVLVEQHVPGDDYRLTVVDGRCISVVRRLPAHVIGNGQDTIATLIALQYETRRAHALYRHFKPATVDDPLVVEQLVRQGLTPKDVPDDGQRVLLRSNSNVSTGGWLEEIEACAHPDNLRLAERAAAAIGLDVAGVDLICRDISVSWRNGEAAICEVNPTPAFFSPDVAKRVVDYLFPAKAKNRIPLIVVVGEFSDAEPLIDQVQGTARESGHVLGCLLGGEAVVDGLPIFHPERPPRNQVGALLADPQCTAALIQLTPRMLAQQGLDAPYCDLAVFCGDERLTTVLRTSPYSVLPFATETLLRPTPGQLAAALPRCGLA